MPLAPATQRCRFLLGSADVMQRVYEGMAAGEEYSQAVRGL